MQTATELATGRLLESHEDRIVLGVPGTEYRLHLSVSEPLDAEVGKRVTGRINALGRRIDVCDTGGAFIDPVYGRPRNLQGRIIDVKPETRALIIKAVVPMQVRIRPPQEADDFRPGQFVTFAIDPGATFTPVQREGNA